MFESVKARLEKLFRDHSRSDPRAYMAGLREALLEAKTGVSTMQSALAATERELTGERRQLADAERRGRLAAEVSDAETIAVAERFAVRHRERIAVLERKLIVQRDELALARREVEDMLGQYRTGRWGAEADSIRAAWRDIEAAGGDRPATAMDDERLRTEADSRLKEQAVEAQLAFLKSKLKKRER
ncbi:MAG TPA: hypothetical protein VJ808_11800 [Gemmatimonadales bacterium]|jgi:hypothetical protein|nr:hypothetical protein [Gemmatimonadales bacterium]